MSGRVLLAEDDGELRRLLASALFARGYDVVECVNGRELARCIDRVLAGEVGWSVDLIVSDIRMPGFSGLEVVEALRGNGERTRVVLMTAFADDGTQQAARSLGVLLLDKPFELEQLFALLTSPG